MTSSTVDGSDSPVISESELEAQELVNRGDIDQALAIYQSLEPPSSRILHLIAKLYVEKKNDDESAIVYLQKALDIREKDDDDIRFLLTELGIVYQNCCLYDLALSYHTRALDLSQVAYPLDSIAVANNLIGIANAYWGQQNFSEALIHAQQALILNESVEENNDLNIATTLAILANIHHHVGDSLQALEFVTRARDLVQLHHKSDSSTLAVLLNNLATIQFSVGLVIEAQLNFVRALMIYEKTLPPQHPKRLAAETNIEHISDLSEEHLRSAYSSSLWNYLFKILLA